MKLARDILPLAVPLLALLIGCETHIQVDAQNKPPAEQHTGEVTVVDVSVGYCLPAEGQKSGTSVCDRTLTLRTDSGVVYQLGLARSGSWPPVWKGMRADIHFRECDTCWPKASEILWVQEIKH